MSTYGIQYNKIMYVIVNCVLLQNLIYRILNLTGSKFLSQKLINIRISKNYFQFLGLISKKVFCIEKQKEDGPPILTWADLVA